jgi:hypothetical protein
MLIIGHCDEQGLALAVETAQELNDTGFGDETSTAKWLATVLLCTRARTRTEIIVSSTIREADLRLRLDEKIAGWPAKEVRALLRHFSRDLWTIKEAANLLGAPEGRTRRLVYTLRKLGYVEVASGQPPGS